MKTAACAVYLLAVSTLLSAAVLWAWPREFARNTVPLSPVEHPGEEPAFPHPVLQLSALEPSLQRAWLSDFIDLGRQGRLGSVQLRLSPSDARSDPSLWRIYVRSAARTRSFRIARPQPQDAAALEWSPFAGTSRSVRRFVQLAAVSAGAGVPEGSAPVLSLRARRRDPRAPWLAVIGVVLLFVPRLARRLRPRLEERWGLLIVGGLVLVNLGFLWDRSFVDWDEAETIQDARDVFLQLRSEPQGFTYPHLLVYGQIMVSTAYSLYLPATGAPVFHDPFSNQMYLQGAPLPRRAIYDKVYLQKLLFGEAARERVFEAANRIIRDAYTLAGCLGPLLAYVLARRVAGERAGALAGLALAVQPLWLYQSIQILPNAPAALVLLAFAWLALRRPRSAGEAFAVSVLAGLAASFKYNPAPIAILLGLLLFDRPVGARARACGLAILGAAGGFLLAYPTLPFRLDRFIAEAGFSAFHYGHWAHPSFEVDRVGPALAHQLYLWPRYGGNYLVALLALVGCLRLLGSCGTHNGRRHCFILLGTPLLGSLLLMRQYVQFGRNYCGVLAFACVMAGLGGDSVIAMATRRAQRPEWQQRLSWAGFCLVAVIILSVGRDLWMGRGLWIPWRTARQQAIEWVNANGRLGSRVALIEPPLASFQGVMVDGGRYRTSRPTSDRSAEPAELADLDYLVVAGLEPPRTSRPIALLGKFGPGGQFGLPEYYAVYGTFPGESTAPR